MLLPSCHPLLHLLLFCSSALPSPLESKSPVDIQTPDVSCSFRMGCSDFSAGLLIFNSVLIYGGFAVLCSLRLDHSSVTVDRWPFNLASATSIVSKIQNSACLSDPYVTHLRLQYRSPQTVCRRTSRPNSKRRTTRESIHFEAAQASSRLRVTPVCTQANPVLMSCVHAISRPPAPACDLARVQDFTGSLIVSSLLQSARIIDCCLH